MTEDSINSREEQLEKDLTLDKYFEKMKVNKRNNLNLADINQLLEDSQHEPSQRYSKQLATDEDDRNFYD